jgi:hypothetical protein
MRGVQPAKVFHVELRWTSVSPWSLVQTLRTIIEIGAGVNRLGSDGCTPLMHAAKVGWCKLKPPVIRA